MINLLNRRIKETPKTYTYEIDVHKRIEALENEVADLKAENEKLYRIVKYASSNDETFTHHLEKINIEAWGDGYYFGMKTQYKLYVYFNKEEYCISLPELRDEKIINNSDIITAYQCMGDDYVLFNVKTTLCGCKEILRKHQFIINYKTGQYVHNVEETWSSVYDDCKSETKGD